MDYSTNIQETVTGSTWDPTSLMHYSFKANLIAKPAPYNVDGIRAPTDFSQKDIERAARFYPRDENTNSIKVSSAISAHQIMLPAGIHQIHYRPDKFGFYSFTCPNSTLVISFCCN